MEIYLWRSSHCHHKFEISVMNLSQKQNKNKSCSLGVNVKRNFKLSQVLAANALVMSLGKYKVFCYFIWKYIKIKIIVYLEHKWSTDCLTGGCGGVNKMRYSYLEQCQFAKSIHKDGTHSDWNISKMNQSDSRIPISFFFSLSIEY